jgi:hypothetical protein
MSAGCLVSGVSNGAAPPAESRDAAAASAPAIVFDPQTVRYDERSKVRDFIVHLIFPGKPQTAPAVELVLDVGRGEPRAFAAVPGGVESEYRVSAPLVPEYLHPPRLRLTARYPNGSVSCNVEDTDLDLAGRTLMLSDIRTFEGGKAPRLTLATGESLHSLPTGLQNMRADLGPVALTLNLARADAFTIEPVQASPEAVHFKIQVKEADRLIAEKSGVIRVAGAPGSENATSGQSPDRSK